VRERSAFARGCIFSMMIEIMGVLHKVIVRALFPLTYLNHTNGEVSAAG
jgi:hypothetical protein